MKYKGEVNFVEEFKIKRANIRRPFTGQSFQDSEGFDAFALLALFNISYYVLMYGDYPQYTFFTNSHLSDENDMDPDEYDWLNELVDNEVQKPS